MKLRIVAVVISGFIGSLANAGPAMAQDATAGNTLFKQRCAVCHSTSAQAKGGIGPNLLGVVNRKAASDPNFKYSPALANSKQRWDKVTLDKYLTAPSKTVPGTRMVVSITDAKQRADVISFLATLK